MTQSWTFKIQFQYSPSQSFWHICPKLHPETWKFSHLLWANPSSPCLLSSAWSQPELLCQGLWMQLPPCLLEWPLKKGRRREKSKFYSKMFIYIYIYLYIIWSRNSSTFLFQKMQAKPFGIKLKDFIYPKSTGERYGRRYTYIFYVSSILYVHIYKHVHA